MLFDESPPIIFCEDLTQKNLKKRKLYEGAKKFQNVSITKLPWVKFMIDDKGLMQQIMCKICSYVEGKEKLIVPKLNSLLQHASHRKCKISMLEIDASFYYYNEDYVHAKNECAFTTYS
jgi:hypothetical protein